MIKKVKTKFILFTIFFIVLIVGIPVSFLIHQFRENFHQRSTIMLETTLDMLNYGLENAMMLGYQKNIQHIVDKIALNQSIEHIRIISKDGDILFSSRHEELNKKIRVIAPYHVDINDLTRRKIKLLNEYGIYNATEPIVNKPECRPCHGDNNNVIAYLDVDTDLTTAETKFYTGSTHMIFLAITATIILIIGFYYLFVHFINSPLQNLMGAMNEVQEGNLSTRLPVKKDDEFGVLNKNFNRMVERLNESQEEIRKLNFEQLQHADKLIKLGELTSETAHEINNHIAIIMSRADYLALEGENDPNLKNYIDDLNVIVDQINKVSEITGNILKHSKKLPKKFKEIELTDALEQSIQILEPAINKRNISINKNITAGNLTIFGDLLQIEQVLTNIILNSIDAAGEDGKIDIEIYNKRDDKVEIKISDNGHGINESIRDQVFSPFFSTKTFERGSGLGLFIVKNICENHNAEISFDSVKNEGTSFKITFMNIKK